MRAVIITAAVILILNLLPHEWGYEAGKWTRAMLGFPPIEAADG